MLESLSRREQFRQVWGVSPKSINQKRNVKTLIGAHQISFAETGTEPTLTEINKLEDDIFEVGNSDKMFGESDSNENENENENEAFDVEGILPTLALDFSIPSELFAQYIDANFPSATDEDDSDATPFHNVEEVFASHDKLVEQTSDDVTNPSDDDTDSERSTPETDKPDLADEMLDKFEEEDMEIESDNADSVDEEQVVDESKSPVDENAPSDVQSQDDVPKLTDVEQKGTNVGQNLSVVEQKQATVDQNPQKVETFDFRSLIAAAKTFKMECSKKQKSVRFLTPQKSDVLSYDANDVDDVEDDGKENAVDLPEREAALVSVNIPVKKCFSIFFLFLLLKPSFSS